MPCCPNGVLTYSTDHSGADNEGIWSQSNLNVVSQLRSLTPAQHPVSATTTLDIGEKEACQSSYLSSSQTTSELSQTASEMVHIWDSSTKRSSGPRSLTVDIPEPTQTLSESESCIITPESSNQLQGIVIESLRTSVSRPSGKDTIEDSGRGLQELIESDQQSKYLVDRQMRLSQRLRQLRGPRRSSQDSTTISSLSPALSSTSHSTGTSSCHTDSTAPTNKCIRSGISGTASQDTSTYRTSLHSRTGSSVASTLCHSTVAESVDSVPRRPRGVRRYVRWARSVASDLGQSRCDVTMVEPTLEFSPTIPPVMVMDGSQREPHRPTLKELSKRSTRYYKKGDHPPTGGQGVMNYKAGKKGPKKPDAKTFFSNERTFLHWIKFGLLLGSMAMTLLSFGKDIGMQVGLFLVLVAMSTLVYATTTFHLRHRWMEQMRVDVKFYDRVGPTILFTSLFVAFAVNIACRFWSLLSIQGSDK